jgi:hypothetical protein
MDAILPLLSAGQDSPPCPTSAFADPHPTTLFLSHSHRFRTSKWMEPISLVETSAAACEKALTFSWISRFGAPETITSDREPQFTSNLWSQLCSM